jgi:hypothetical protein
VAKKKREGDLPDLPEIPSVGQLKPTDYLFVGREKDDLIPIPEDCGFKHHPDGLPNLDIIRKKGRATGSSIVYDPNSAYNYLSVSERYDKAQTLYPEYLHEGENGVQIYGFCSSNSPTGYWEVSIGGRSTATFIEFDPPFLTILCPAPFMVSELTTLTSDTTTYKWTQISGSRTALIIPDDIQDPIIDIQTTCYTGGCNENTQEPIRIRVETDNPLVFTDLIILNRATDNWDGGGYVYVNTELECRKITTLYRVPDNEQLARIWDCSAIRVTWTDPSCDSSYVYQFRLNQLLPPYATVDTISINQNRIFSVLPNIRYRLLADYNILGRLETSTSEPIEFSCDIAQPIKTIFADDSGKTLGYAYQSTTTTVTNFGNQVRLLIDDTDRNSASYAYISTSTTVTEFGAQFRELVDDNDTTGTGYAYISTSTIITDLGGIVIG